MAKTIPQLTDATTVNAADELIIQQGGITKRATAAELMNNAPVTVTSTTTARPLAERFADMVSVKDFGAVGDGVADDTAAIQAAINLVSGTSRTLFLPSTSAAYRTTAPLNISDHVRIVGEGVETVNHIANGQGSWIFADHAGRALSIIGAEFARISAYLDGFAFRRNQPIPSGGFSPNNIDFDLYIDNVEVNFGTIGFLNATRAVRVGQAANGFAAFSGYRLWGQPLSVGLQIDQLYRHPTINNIEWWPYWQDDNNVHAWTDQNLIGCLIFRCDAMQLNSFFCIRAFVGFAFGQNSSGHGTAQRLQIGLAYVDLSTVGILVDTAVTNGVLMQIGSLNTVGNQGAPGAAANPVTHGIRIRGDNCRMDIGQFEGYNIGKQIITDEGNNNVINIGCFRPTLWNVKDSGAELAPAISATFNGIITVQAPVVSGNGNGARIVGPGQIDVRGVSVTINGTLDGAGEALFAYNGLRKAIREVEAVAYTTGDAAWKCRWEFANGNNIKIFADEAALANRPYSALIKYDAENRAGW
jgi:hypothetical protein